MTDRTPMLTKIGTAGYTRQNHDAMAQHANDALRAGNYELAAAFAQAAAAYAVAHATYGNAPE
jgi:hypothetical protein